MNEMTDSASPTVAEASPLVKTCTKCGVEKLLVEFSRNKSRKFGRSNWCKACMRAYWQRPDVKGRLIAYRQSPEYRDQQRAYRQRPEVKERQRSYMRALYRQHPGVRARALARKQRCDYLEQQQTYRQRPEVKAARNTYTVDYTRRRRQVDPVFRLKLNLRGRLREVLKGQSKSARTLELVGCDIDFLRRWLEAKFLPGMTWDNYGEWHVDHIMPCASFDLSDPVQQRTCFRWTNLQPLWAVDNLRKSDNYAP